MPNELDMIDSAAILRWEIVRQMRESIKVMTVRIRVVIRRSKIITKIIRFMSRPRWPTPSRNFHGNEKRRAALINVLGTAFWAYIDEFAIVIH